MTPNITTLPKIHLIGQNIKTSFANDETVELWRSFMSRKKEVRHQKDDNLYSVEIYPNSSFFDAFDPTKTFEKFPDYKGKMVLKSEHFKANNNT